MKQAPGVSAAELPQNACDAEMALGSEVVIETEGERKRILAERQDMMFEVAGILGVSDTDSVPNLADHAECIVQKLGLSDAAKASLEHVERITASTARCARCAMDAATTHVSPVI